MSSKSEQSDRFALDVQHFEIARSVHRVVRAMHDGECPRCHSLSPAEDMRRPNDDETCPVCGFTITAAEIDAALALFAPMMERNLAMFEQWRSGLTAETARMSIADKLARRGREEIRP